MIQIYSYAYKPFISVVNYYFRGVRRLNSGSLPLHSNTMQDNQNTGDEQCQRSIIINRLSRFFVLGIVPQILIIFGSEITETLL